MEGSGGEPNATRLLRCPALVSQPMSSAATLTVPGVTDDGPPPVGLTDADRRVLWEQFVEVYSDSQKT
jgi:hypothetical protein